MSASLQRSQSQREDNNFQKPSQETTHVLFSRYHMECILHLEHLQHCSACSCKNISHFQVLVIYLFATLPIKLTLGLQIGGRLLKAMHLEQSNYLANQNQGAVNQYNLTVFTILFQGSSRAMEDVDFSGSWQSSGSIHWL